MKKRIKVKKPIKLNFDTSPEKDAKRVRERDLVRCAEIYDAWRTAFVSFAKPPTEVVSELNSLAATLEQHIQTPDLREYLIQKLINPLLVRAQEAVNQLESTVEILIDCPNKVVVNNVESQCGWGALARPSKVAWEQKAVKMTCPQCGSHLTQEDMVLRSEVEALRAATMAKPPANSPGGLGSDSPNGPDLGESGDGRSFPA